MNQKERRWKFSTVACLLSVLLAVAPSAVASHSNICTRVSRISAVLGGTPGTEGSKV